MANVLDTAYTDTQNDTSRPTSVSVRQRPTPRRWSSSSPTPTGATWETGMSTESQDLKDKLSKTNLGNVKAYLVDKMFIKL